MKNEELENIKWRNDEPVDEYQQEVYNKLQDIIKILDQVKANTDSGCIEKLTKIYDIAKSICDNIKNYD
jgi:hypothetical protein